MTKPSGVRPSISTVHLAIDQPNALGGIIYNTACGRISSKRGFNHSYLRKWVTCKKCLSIISKLANTSFTQAILKHYEESCL